MLKGTVKFFNPDKGFGFITRDGEASDVFLPAASIPANDIAAFKPGRRVLFDEVQDGKGRKAINLKLVEESAPAAPVAPAADARVTLYCDDDEEERDELLAALRAGGCEPVVVNYLAQPPVRDKLKSLSLLLRNVDQSLVRRYDPLFSELQLDDRFISENEFWDAIVEHPALINGPFVATGSRAALVHNTAAVKAFLSPDAQRAAPKALPPGLLKLMAAFSEAPPPRPVASPPPVVQAAAPAPVKNQPRILTAMPVVEPAPVIEKPAAKAPVATSLAVQAVAEPPQAVAAPKAVAAKPVAQAVAQARSANTAKPAAKPVAKAKAAPARKPAAKKAVAPAKASSAKKPAVKKPAVAKKAVAKAARKPKRK
jgi:cold shock CspA family protein/arsenate reductase-like glutaredoxin family protein